MRINLEIGEIQAFVAVAEKASFKAAAESLFISQPALSRRIEKLEECLQTRLLERTTRRVSLTEDGRQFLVHAETVMEELQMAMQGMALRTAQKREHITIACVPSIANHVLPNALVKLIDKHPALRVRIIDESAQEVLNSVVSGAADFGVNFIGTQEADIDFKPICTEHYVLLVRKDHRLAKRKSIAWSTLAGEKLVSVSQNSGNRMLIDNALARLAHRPTIHYEINHITGAINLVAAGLGVAVLPELALAQDMHPNLKRIELTDPDITRTLGLITRKGSQLQPVAQALCELLVQSVGAP